jgi:hypothetical protein
MHRLRKPLRLRKAIGQHLRRRRVLQKTLSFELMIFSAKGLYFSPMLPDDPVIFDASILSEESGSLIND